MLFWFMIWYLSGIVGAIIGTVFDYKNGVDFTINTLLWCVFACLLGPFVIVIVLSCYGKHIVLLKGRTKVDSDE